MTAARTLTWEEHFKAATDFFKGGKFAEAVTSFNEVLKLNANHIDSYLTRARAQGQLNKLAEAAPDFVKAAELYDQANNHAQALKTIEECLKAKADFQPAQTFKAQIEVKIKRAEREARSKMAAEKEAKIAEQQKALEAKSVEQAKLIEAMHAKIAEQGKAFEALQAKIAEQAKALEDAYGKTAEQGKTIETLQIKSAEQAKAIEAVNAKSAEQGNLIANFNKTVEGLAVISETQTRLIKDLREQVANIRTPQQIDNDRFLTAAAAGNTKILKNLLDFGAEINTQNERGDNALHLAMQGGHKEAAEFLLKKEPALFFQANKAGNTAIQQMAGIGELESLSWLYEQGKNIPEFADKPEQFEKVYAIATPEAQQLLANRKLWEAADEGNVIALQNALNKKADINAKAADGDTALHKAVKSQFKEAAKFLIEQGADLDVENENGINILTFAKSKMKKAEFDLHATHEISNDSVLKVAKSIVTLIANKMLLNAARRGQKDQIEQAIKESADVNEAKDSNGATALHLAAAYGNTEAVTLLLENNADLMARDNRQCIPLHYAMRAGNKESTKPLLKQHANKQCEVGKEREKEFTIDTENMDVKTPFDLARDYGHENLANVMRTKFGSEKTKAKILATQRFAGSKITFTSNIGANTQDPNDVNNNNDTQKGNMCEQAPSSSPPRYR